MVQNEQYNSPETNGAAPERPVIDDAQLKQMMHEEQPSLVERYGHCIVTFVLIAINVVVFLIEVVLSGFSLDISVYTLFGMGAMYAPAIQSPPDFYRFITPMFLHVDIMHLLFNMAALYSVGVMLEGFLGRGNYLLLYFIGGITGNVLSFYVESLTGSYAISAGASTSIFGLFMATALLGVLSKTNREYLMQFSKGMLGVIGINIVYTLLVASVSVSGHIGGALGGIIGMFIIPCKNLRVPVWVRIIAAVIWIAAIAHVLGYSQGISLFALL